MFTVGLTGGVAAGKSTATKFFESEGIHVIDADIISRNLQLKDKQGYISIVEKLGSEILDFNEEIDRKKIRDLAFNDSKLKQWLEDLMHPLIQQEVLKQFENIKSSWAIYSAPLWSNKNIFNRTLVIGTTRELQIQRIIERNDCSESDAIKIIENQLTSNQRYCFATDLIMNDEDLESFQKKLKFYLDLYTNLAHEQKN